jgi:SAM-dependent methyltransferase
MKNSDSKIRFSDRVENYVKYRPHYPKEIINFLKENCDLNEKSIIADIGSGTGISSELFLENGNSVFAVEPNYEMRNAAEKILSKYSNFISISGTAENTSLQSDSVDFIIAGQAFHWFDTEICKTEFKRILKKDGFVILLWNSRISKEGFMNEYEDLLIKFGTDYIAVNHENISDKDIEKFYFPEYFNKKIMMNFQELDYEGLKGRLLSSSYVPNEKSPEFPEMLKTLEKIFKNNSVSGTVKMEYETIVYTGKM